MLIPAMLLAGWTATTTTDKMTDRAVIVMTQDATEGGAYLKVQCAGKDFRMVLKTEASPRVRVEMRWGYPAYVEGMWRLDSAKAEGLKFGVSAGGSDTMVPISMTHARDGGKFFFGKMATAKQVIFQPEMASGTVSAFTFSLEGLDLGALKGCYP